jgi:hypothetical protein
LQQTFPSVPCEALAQASECTFPSEWGDVVVSLDGAAVVGATLRGEASTDRREMRLANRNSLYSAISRQLGPPADEFEGPEYSDYIAIWTGQDGSELTLQVQDRVLMLPPQHALTLGGAGSGAVMVEQALKAFDQRVAELIAMRDSGRLSLGGATLGDPLPGTIHHSCRDRDLTCSVYDKPFSSDAMPLPIAEIARDAQGRVMRVTASFFGSQGIEASVDASIARSGVLERVSPETSVFVAPTRWRSARGDVLEVERGDGLTGARLTLRHDAPASGGFGPAPTP